MALSDEELQNNVNSRWEALPKLYLPKQLIPLLGYTATSVLAHFQWEFSEGNRVEKQPGGKMALRQSIAEMADFIACSPHTLRGPKGSIQRLLDLKLIFLRKPSHGRNRSSLWLLNHPRLDTLLNVADALHRAPSLKAWQAWQIENPSLFKKFESLPWESIEKGFTFNDSHEMSDNESNPTFNDNHEMAFNDSHEMIIRRDKEEKRVSKETLNQPPAEGEIFKSSSLETKSQNKDSSEPDKFVEHWNSQPHVPKCRPKTKAYEYCRRFFTAHKKYEAGECSGFTLTEDVRKKIKLSKINKRPEGVTIRPDKEIFAHIEQAALVYDPKYAPINKKWLSKSLSDFLYNNGQHNKTGTRSYFLEKIAFPPQLIEDESYQAMINNADDWELEIADSIRHVYFIACGRDKTEQLSLSEFKSALSIARKIADQYCDIPIDKVHILAHHFPDYSAFVTWWRNYCEENVWEGMPITALDPSKDIWRRFIDHVSSDIGWDILTGERR